VTLRDYQQRAIDQTYDWLESNDGNVCLVMPTGSGKSHIIAGICKDAVQNWPETRVLMLTHVKELIAQNADKMVKAWPGAPMGVYSAGLGKRELGEPITFGSIQSLRNKADYIGHVDLVIVDECHLISHKDQGGYRTVIGKLTEINPSLRVIGLTATPWRLGHGLITDEPAIFNALIEPVTIEELIARGFLAPLRSKHTEAQLSVAGVHKRGGEYIESELQKAVDTDPQTQAVVGEIVERGADRKAWLCFCAGVAHAEHVRDALRERDITAEMVLGSTPSNERADILRRFMRGEIRALTNANVLTTGFDYPDIDLIAMLRPTMSPSLYVQMSGRGMRPKSEADDCLVLDFAGVVEQHGPITNVSPPKKSGEKGEAPTRTCPECGEICFAAVRVCPSCGFEFPPPVQADPYLRNDDIMGIEPMTMTVSEWNWTVHTSYTSGMSMLKVEYRSGNIGKPVTEYLTVLHTGYAGRKAIATLSDICKRAIGRQNGVEITHEWELLDIAQDLSDAPPPKTIDYMKDGNFARVLRRNWWHQQDLPIGDKAHETSGTGISKAMESRQTGANQGGV